MEETAGMTLLPLTRCTQKQVGKTVKEILPLWAAAAAVAPAATAGGFLQMYGYQALSL